MSFQYEFPNKATQSNLSAVPEAHDMGNLPLGLTLFRRIWQCLLLQEETHLDVITDYPTIGKRLIFYDICHEIIMLDVLTHNQRKDDGTPVI